MRKRLARTLWLLAALSLPLSGCGTKKSAEEGAATTGTTATVDMDDEAAEGEEAPAPGRAAVAEKKVAIGGAPHQPPAEPPTAGNTEDYTDYGVNPLTDTAEDELSTFAVDVDTASYAIARSKILGGQLPPAAAVRVEEFVNYFKYDYAPPTDGPFAVHMDAAPSPFHKDRHLLRVGVKAKEVSIAERKPANLVFLVDVSGSMNSPNKLPLAKRALRVLVDNLKDGDKVSLVTYAGNTRAVLQPTDIAHKAHIHAAIEDLTPAGSTAMASGLELAYDLAAKGLAPNTESRVIVLSDGDANVGNTSHDRILESIASKVSEGVTLSTIGLGMGNYKDTMMEQLANKGNGNYYYIDSFNQAKRVFQEQLGGTLEVVAKDVKLQVELDPKVVKQYRLVGYENRDIADDDFRDDKVDAGEIGAGHSVTAIYEIVLADEITAGETPSSLATVRVRWKQPKGTKAAEKKFQFPAGALASSFDGASKDLRFATAVMATAEILRQSPHAKSWKVERIEQIAQAASADDNPERQEFISLLDQIAPLHKVAAK